jgi:hypothetical protein
VDYRKGYEMHFVLIANFVLAAHVSQDTKRCLSKQYNTAQSEDCGMDFLQPLNFRATGEELR